ncbi:TAT-variant-translocated molybdopterin oxidoreductase [Chelativorans sp. AA-79]|uniref:TAT-variant-translocated molybdopterin oxidoreductase n=1 Tax=Chelativorans sp. AA-79 TaxID=3028735 RepID=UPI0023F9B2A0|nr:TAT-variant-translocated molybdopterin oxidoreductase [Chelativorans sp. AA-79]WEX10562.1 TAT-variant-translocated molybdopterin oxidoreductase [Chelativorans sp. AA-79]
MGRTAPADSAAMIRSRLRGKTGRAFWRSLDELSRTVDFQAFLEAEFPSLAPTAAEVDRRGLLKVMGASLALAGLSGCSGQADDRALPYVQSPEFVVPGNPKYYATAVTMAGYAQPVTGKTHVGRPVKLEGNPGHPGTKGATDPFLQAALLGLYDPDRSQSPRRAGRPASWEAFDGAMVARARELDARRGAGFRLLTGAVTSPTLARQIAAMMQRWPQARWHVLEPVDDGLRREAVRRVFGRALQPHPMLDRAEAVVSLDDDLLGPGPYQAVRAHRWSLRRHAFQRGEGESRLLVAEPVPTITGAMAEDRLIIAPARTVVLAQALARGFGVPGGTEPALTERERQWVDAATATLRAHPGRALISVGARHAPEVQALGFLINERIGALGATLRFTDPITVEPPDGMRSMEALVEAMNAGDISTLAMLGVNPAYATPSGLGFREALEKVELRIHAGLHYDETAARSHWHVPVEHELETWSDARAVDGTVSVLQPLVRPFHSVRSQHAILENLAGRPGAGSDAVRETWRAEWGGPVRRALARGAFPGLRCG